jgi:hypothetical protein
MTHQRPIPDAAVSPYPLHPEPHDETGPAFFAKGTHQDDDENAQYSLAERFSLADALSSNNVAIGAAIGLGVAAIAGVLLYGRSKTKEPPARPARRAAAVRTNEARARKPRATKAKAASA